MIPDNQTGFRPGDSCINQLLSINCKIYKLFDNNLEVRAILLDISKASDKYNIKVLYTDSSKMEY